MAKWNPAHVTPNITVCANDMFQVSWFKGFAQCNFYFFVDLVILLLRKLPPQSMLRSLVQSLVMVECFFPPPPPHFLLSESRVVLSK